MSDLLFIVSAMSTFVFHKKINDKKFCRKQFLKAKKKTMQFVVNIFVNKILTRHYYHWQESDNFYIKKNCQWHVE